MASGKQLSIVFHLITVLPCNISCSLLSLNIIFTAVTLKLDEVRLIQRLFPDAHPQRILIRASLSPGAQESSATHLFFFPGNPRCAWGAGVSPSAANKQRVRVSQSQQQVARAPAALKIWY